MSEKQARRYFQLKHALEVLQLPPEHRVALAELASNLEMKLSKKSKEK